MAEKKISAQANHVTSFTNKPRFPVADDPTGTPVSGYMDTDDISTIADASAAAAIALLTIGNVSSSGAVSAGNLAVWIDEDTIEDGGAIPDIALLVTGDASVTDGHVAVFDADGYHIKDGGEIVSGSSIKVLTTQFDKTNSTPTEISALSIDVVAGGTYIFRGVFQATCEAAAGVVLGLDGTVVLDDLYCATSTATDATLGLNGIILRNGILNFPAGLISVGAGETELLLTIEGSFNVATSGTIYPTFAQLVTNVLPSSVLVGSYFRVEKVA